MATTMYLATTLKDLGGAGEPIDIEAGTMSYYNGVKQLYLTLNDKTLILDDTSGRQPCAAFADIAAYLGYDR